MTAARRSNYITAAIFFAALLLFSLLFARLAGAGIDAGEMVPAPAVEPLDAGPNRVAAALDPVVAGDHADRVQRVAMDVDNVPAVRFSPTRYAEFVAWLKRMGENTGGAWIAALVAIGIRRARRRWPALRRGWTDEVTATAFASAVWVAGSLATGATWGTAALGVVMAALAGTLLAVVPGERPGQGEGGEAEAGGVA